MQNKEAVGEAKAAGVSLAGRTASVLDRLVFFALLALIIFSIIPYGTVDQWWEAVFESFVFGITALWIFEVLLRGSWQIKKASVLLPLVLITLYAFLQTMPLPKSLFNPRGSAVPQSTISIDVFQTSLTAVKMLALTLFTGLLLLHVTDRKRLVWTIRVVIGVGIGSTVFGILRQLLQSPEGTTGFVLPFLFPGMGFAQFISANAFSYLVEMSLALVGGVLVGGSGLRGKQFLTYSFGGLILLSGLILSNSRGAVVGFACQTVFLLFVGLSWFASKQTGITSGWLGAASRIISTSVPARIATIVVMISVLLLGIVWLAGQNLASKANERTSVLAASDGTTRKDIWKATYALIKRHPLTGVGFGAYFLAITEYQESSGRLRVQQAHNDYLDLMAAGGVIAVVLAAWFVILIIRRVRTTLSSKDRYRRAVALGALAGIISVSVHSFVDFGLQVTGVAVVCAALMVIAVVDVPFSEELGNRRVRRRRSPRSSDQIAGHIA